MKSKIERDKGETERELTMMRRIRDMKMPPSRPMRAREKTMMPPTSRNAELVMLELPVITSSFPSLTATPHTPSANSMTPMNWIHKTIKYNIIGIIIMIHNNKGSS